ncbi:MAG: electron transport complex subunit RsxB [Sterolibacterium sp.]|nr:electron transport complex subunit RsxB [Sterolibacterium sp.]
MLVVAFGVVPKIMASAGAPARTRSKGEQLAIEIDALLPQTQCRRCGFSGCKPYAYAIAEGWADINQCPPGGAQGIRKLAALLGREFKPLNPEHGVEKPKAVAFIDENTCIGCTLCIQACPVDAIIGAAKQMHTVVAAWCTGCELCVSPCPTDCISMLALENPKISWKSKYPLFEILGVHQPNKKSADLARARYEFHLFREERERREKTAKLTAKAAAMSGGEDPKQALIAAAIVRAQQQKERVKPENTQQLTPDQLTRIAEIEARRSGLNKL